MKTSINCLRPNGLVFFVTKLIQHPKNICLLHVAKFSAVCGYTSKLPSDLFDELSRKNIFTLSRILASHLQNKDPLATWVLFQFIHRSHTDLNSYVLSPVLGACSVLPDAVRGRQVHALMIKYGFNSEPIPQTGLMNMYSKQNLMAESSKVFGEMCFKDVVSWNALISNYLEHSMAKKALDAFDEMRRTQVGCSRFTLCSLLKACQCLGAHRQGLQIHGLIITLGRDLVVLGTALINFYSHFRMIDKAIHVYESVGCEKDYIMHNSIVAACVRNGKYDKVLWVLHNMKPNAIALTSALSACSESSNLWLGKQIHCVAVRFGFVDETQFCNVLLDMYAKCGKISLARSVFDRMPRRNVVSWTSMIDGYCSSGDGIAAVELFQVMKKEGGVLPNEWTFLSVLSACSHSGLVTQGRECFQLMQNSYNLAPGPKHYACYIDILGRAGHIEEVWCVYENMVKRGFKPTDVVWAALVNACGHNNDALRGEFAAKHLLELGQKPGTYMLISNIYASVGKWDVADQLRNAMKGKGISKNVGISWIAS